MLSLPEAMGRVLAIGYRAIETHLIQQADFTRATARTGTVTLIQRFGSALNQHTLPYAVSGQGVLDRRRATRVPPPPGAESPGVNVARGIPS